MNSKQWRDDYNAEPKGLDESYIPKIIDDLEASEVENANLRSRLEKVEKVQNILVDIASWLGFGPGDLEYTNAQDMEARIKQGIDHHINVQSETRCQEKTKAIRATTAAAEARLAALIKAVEERSHPDDGPCPCCGSVVYNHNSGCQLDFDAALQAARGKG